MLNIVTWSKESNKIILWSFTPSDFIKLFDNLSPLFSSHLLYKYPLCPRVILFEAHLSKVLKQKKNSFSIYRSSVREVCHLNPSAFSKLLVSFALSRTFRKEIKQINQLENFNSSSLPAVLDPWLGSLMSIGGGLGIKFKYF